MSPPIWERLAASRVIDLAQPMHRGMPVSPNHSPYQMALTRRHGDIVRPDGSSAANEMIVTGGHVGTHVDALCHVSFEGRLHGGIVAAAVQSQHGYSKLGIEGAGPFLSRGVLLDVAAAQGVEVLDPGYEITVGDLERAQEAVGVEVMRGDAVLIRSGWPRYWRDPITFTGQSAGAPGLGESAGRWLAERQVRITGAETIAYEVIPAGAGHNLLPVHRLLLVEAGIHIIEVMNLDDLAAVGIHEFGFVAIPLKLVGATGSPIRPLALIDG